MKVTLYHGTSESHARSIVHEGIHPRGEGDGEGEGEDRGNWDVPSSPDMVYLTRVYAGYFAAAASESNEKWAIVEVSVDHVNLLPDEDFLEQATRDSPDTVCPLCGMEARTEWFRDNLHNFSHHALDSLDAIGNVAHRGMIPVSNITRATLFDPRKSPMLAIMAVDPAICIANHRFMGDRYRALTRALMGYEVEAKALAGVFWQAYDEEQRATYRKALSELHLALEVIYP